jgi:hypothetical protein
MAKKFHINPLLALVMSAALLTSGLASCEYQSLEEMRAMERSEFTLGFAHSNVDSVPASYRVAFYPADEQTRENITNGYMLFDLLQGSHKLSLPCGSYKVTAWNHDTEHVLTNGYGTRDLVNATTQAYRSRGAFDTPKVVDSLYHGQTILDYPDYMTHANVENFILQSTEAEQKLILTPDSMVVTVDLSIGGVRGLAEVLEARGSINNVAGKRYIAKDNFTEDSVVVIFDCTCQPETNTVKARFYLFGLEPTEFPNLEHKIILYFWLTAGKVYIPLDVTSLIAKARATKVLNVHVEDLNIDLREYVSSSSGYEVTIDEWDNIHIGIDL